MTILCLSGPSAEELFFGAISTDSDHGDIVQAREILSREYDALRLGFELARLRDAARSLVRTPWAQPRITAIANALLKSGSLTAAQIEQIAALG